MSYAMDDDVWGLRRIEIPARELIDYGLGQGRSTIDPEARAWGEETVADLRHRIVDNADMGEGTFLGKLRDQCDSAPRETVLFTAELLALQVIPLGNVSGATKLDRIQTVLGWLNPSPELPDELRTALDGPGVFNGGTGFNVQIWRQLGWLLELIEYWWEQPEERRSRALADPWVFREVVDECGGTQVAIRNSLLYLAYPRTFPPIVSQDHKVAIRNTFASMIGGGTGNDAIAIDRDLDAIHRKQEQQSGVPVDYYHEPYASQWQKPRKTSDDGARGWLVRPRLGGRDLVTRWRDEGFVSLAGTHLGDIEPGASRKAITEAVEAGYQHLDYAQRLTLANEYHLFLNAMKPDDLVATVVDDQVYLGTITGEARHGPDRNARWQRDMAWHPSSVGAITDLPAPLPGEIEQQGTVVDITGAMEALAALARPEQDEAGEPEVIETPTPAMTPPALRKVTAELASSLHLDQAWLQELVDVLQDRQQAVLYGPPGTGKTYLARKLARHLTEADAIELVQFHPSYAYEDFFEGYRPREDGTFALTPGPLRRLAATAREDPERAYILIIDEINRANLAKVFGELYFLLEYRNDSILLQYSPGQSFTLPANVFFVGTMNTADRSIALVDAAMRRRFAFLELHPDEPPVDALLTNWLSANGTDTERAELLRALNDAIGEEDHDFKIGPSYLMTPDAEREGGLERIWRYSILPLLEEHYYGRLTRHQVHARFGLETIRRMVAPAPPAMGDE